MMRQTGEFKRLPVGKDTITASQAVTLWDLFRERVLRCSDATAYRDYNSTNRVWCDHSWRMISERVDRFRAALALESHASGKFAHCI